MPARRPVTDASSCGRGRIESAIPLKAPFPRAFDRDFRAALPKSRLVADLPAKLCGAIKLAVNVRGDGAAADDGLPHIGAPLGKVAVARDCPIGAIVHEMPHKAGIAAMRFLKGPRIGADRARKGFPFVAGHVVYLLWLLCPDTGKIVPKRGDCKRQNQEKRINARNNMEGHKSRCIEPHPGRAQSSPT